MILIWRVGDRVKIDKLTYAIIETLMLQAWVSLHTVATQNRNFKLPSTAFLITPPNIMFANNSAYTVLIVVQLLS